MKRLLRWRWYWSRLRVMSAREVYARLREQATLARIRHRWRRNRLVGSLPGKVAFVEAADVQLPDLPLTGPGPDIADDALLSGEWPALGFGWRWSRTVDSWRVAPDTQRIWPVDFFAGIDSRSGNPHGDPRVVWEVARLQQLFELAIRARLQPQKSGEYAAVFEAILGDWVERNPPGTGIHYQSAMECALRIISVSHAFDLLRTYLSDRRKVGAEVVRLVTSHAKLIALRPSLYSSAGNHTIAEGAGLFYAGKLYKEHPEATAWRDLGLRLLENEVPRQILDDGGGIEQAFWYHRFVIDLTGLVVSLVEHQQSEVPAWLMDPWSRGRRFLDSIAVPSAGALPDVGDRDDGYALSPRLRWPVEGHSSFPVMTFADSGYTVLKGAAEPSIQLLFDHGPLGMAPGYGHGHADALALLAWIGSEPLLVDCGTGSYTGDTSIRRRLRGTRSHNTLLVNETDQAIQAGEFLWSKNFNAVLVDSTNAHAGTTLLACHDGYRRFGILHWRGVWFEPTGVIAVWDRIDGVGRHELKQVWHVDADVDTVRGRNGALKMRSGRTIRVLSTGGELVRDCGSGDEKPICSPVYGQFRSQTAFCLAASGAAPMQLTTIFLTTDTTWDDGQLREQIERWQQLIPNKTPF